MPAPTFVPIPGFVDNYFWLLHAGGRAAVVDPGDAAPVLDALSAMRLDLAAIVITHHHADHVGGIPGILRHHAVPVFGPRAEAPGIPGLTHPLAEGDRIELPGLGLELDVWEVPGHTLGHIAYVHRRTDPGFVLCGDTLFKAGCGRLFEGTARQLHRSLDRLAGLPPDTAVYCTHEYTLANLRFAAAVLPQDPDIADEMERVAQRRAQDLPSLPSTIGVERRTNPFLRCGESAVRGAVESRAGRRLDGPEAVFAELRRWKDGFRTA